MSLSFRDRRIVASHCRIPALALVLAACQDVAGPAARPEQIAAPVFGAATGKAGPKIPDQYIVLFKDFVPGDEVEGRATALLKAMGGKLQYTYTASVRGFSGNMSSVVAGLIASHPSVAHVEQDEEVSINTTQSSPPWGLDRVDQANLPLGGTYIYTNTGSGVNAYIIDTGILTTHVEFGTRASGAFSAIADGYGATGCHWHGTHVAGTVGGNSAGVAKAVKLYSVRVLDCNGSGTNSGVIAGIDWVTANRLLPAVANMSLGGGYSQALNDAVQRSINAGVSYVVAAGNNSADACSYSPASTPAALTVGATTSSDAQSSFSNFGSCLDLYAPGSSIYSAMTSSNTAMGYANGTSMAAPHVAGAAALYLQSYPSASPAAVATALINSATSGVLSGVGAGSVNRLVRTNTTTQAPTPPPDAAPVASFTVSCSGATCTFNASASTDDKGIVNYAWNYGDGTSSNSSNTSATRTYTASGTYTVTLTVKDSSNQTNSTTRTATVTVPTANQPPVANFTWTCQGLTCTFDGTSSTDDGQVVQYSWNLNKWPDGSATGPVVTATYPHSSTRNVTLTVTDNAGSTSSITKSVTISDTPPPDAKPTASFNASCNGLTCSFDGSSSSDDKGIVNYAWNFGDGASAASASSATTRTYTSAGTYSVTLTVTDGAGQTSSTTKTVTATAPNAAPVASFTVSCAALVCRLDARGSTDDGQIVSYSWDLNRYPNPSASGAVVDAAYPHTGLRTVTLVVTDNNGQTSSVSKTFNVQ